MLRAVPADVSVGDDLSLDFDVVVGVSDVLTATAVADNVNVKVKVDVHGRGARACVPPS